MYKVDLQRNVFEEIDKILIKARHNTPGYLESSISTLDTFGLRSWFNVTQTLESLIKQTKQVENKSNKIKLLKRYFNESHKLYKLGNLNHFPIKLT